MRSERTPATDHTVTATRRVSLRPIALPNEHGAWAFLFEPALLGLLLAPSWSGVLLIVAALGALLAQNPIGMVLTDARRGRSYPRTRVARVFAALYTVLTLVATGGAIALAGSPVVLLPALVAAPLALLQLGYSARHRGRDLAPELAGATAMGALAACIALAGGWPLAPALVLWGLLAARTIPSILYVRSRLRLEREQPAASAPALIAHLIAPLGVAGLAAFGATPWLATLPFLLLLLRAALGLSPRRRPAKAKTIGLRELAFGLMVVVTVALGYATLR
jgi:hypothetical protein